MPALRYYEISLRGDYEGKYTQRVMALSAGKAKYDYWLDARDAWPEFHWRELRCKSLGLAYELKPPADERERRILHLMRHAMGLDHLGFDPHGRLDGYRNYFACGPCSTDWELLSELCSSEGRLPLLAKRDADALAQGMVYFHVTITGRDYVRRRTGVDDREVKQRPVKTYKRIQMSIQPSDR